MKKVIVLIDNEKRSSPFLQNLDSTSTFQYKVSGLFSLNEKIIDSYKQQDGFIILLDCNQVSRKTSERISGLIQGLPDAVIVFVIEKYSKPAFNEQILQFISSLKDLTNQKRQMFLVDYTNRYKDKRDPQKWFNDMIERYDKPSQPPSEITSKTISDKDLKQRFEDLTLPLHVWNHYSKLRLIYIACRDYGIKDTVDLKGWLCTNWKKYKSSWHYTLIRFWINIIESLQKNYKTFDEMYQDNPQIHNEELFKEYYSNNLLSTDYVKNNWILPDKIKLDDPVVYSNTNTTLLY